MLNKQNQTIVVNFYLTLNLLDNKINTNGKGTLLRVRVSGKGEHRGSRGSYTFSRAGEQSSLFLKAICRSLPKGK